MTTAPKPFVFVLMPFSKKFNDLYNLGIRPACEEAGAYCQRVSEQIYEGKIIDRIYNQIATADFIVAVMTGKNPNVFYEVGYAHALNKRVILTTNKVKDIPFDLASYPHIEYSDISELKQEVSKRLRFLIANPEKVSTYFNFPLKFLHNGNLLENITELPLPRYQKRSSTPLLRGQEHLDSSMFILNMNIMNSIEQKISQVDFRLGLICRKNLKLSVTRQSGNNETSYNLLPLKQEDKSLFYLLDADFSLLPGCFEALDLHFYQGGEDFQSGTALDFTVRILTEAGVFDKDIKFILK